MYLESMVTAVFIFFRLPFINVVTANFVYIRMHGTREHHATDYTDAELQTWADRIHGWRVAGLDVYCYFQADLHAIGYIFIVLVATRHMLFYLA